MNDGHCFRNESMTETWLEDRMIEGTMRMLSSLDGSRVAHCARPNGYENIVRIMSSGKMIKWSSRFHVLTRV